MSNKRQFIIVQHTSGEFIVVFICFMERLSLFLFVLWRVYHCFYLFYGEFIIVFICFMESLSLFLFVLWRVYRCFYLFYGEFIVVFICFIDVGPHAHQKNAGKEIVFTLKPLTISPTSQVNNKYKR
jgi:hypothetical protein